MEGLRQKGEEKGGQQVSPALPQGNSFRQQRGKRRHKVGETRGQKGAPREEQRDKKQKLGGSEKGRDGHTETDTQEKLRAGVGAALEWGAQGRESEMGVAREGMFQKGALRQTVG